MEKVAKIGSLLALALLLAPGFAPAQEHAATDAELRSAVAERTEREEADRAVLERLLEREEVREIAGKAGIDVERAKDAVAGLDGRELAALAAAARDVEDRLAGGQATIRITYSALVLALLVAILILVL